MMIHLTAEEADQVRGPTSPMHALMPRKLKDGTYVLPESVLDDPAHIMHHDFLQTMPTIADPTQDDYYASTGATGP